MFSARNGAAYRSRVTVGIAERSSRGGGVEALGRKPDAPDVPHRDLTGAQDAELGGVGSRAPRLGGTGCLLDAARNYVTRAGLPGGAG